MKRSLGLLTVVLFVQLTSMIQSSDPGGPPAGNEWKILTPGGDNDTFDGDIPCSGSSGELGKAFTLHVVKFDDTSVSLGGASGTSNSTQYDWEKTVPEKQGGWTSNNQPIKVCLQLKVDGDLIHSRYPHVR